MKTSNHTIWVEKYRPDTLEGYVGNETLRAKLAQYIEEQNVPHLLFYGTAGTGKTTAAKILKNNLDADCLFINASDERGIDTIRDKLKGFASTRGFKKFKLIILDEADAITRDGQRALRNMMEQFSENTKFVLTANYVENIIDPLVSRTQVFRLIPPSKKEVAARLVDILKNENVEYSKDAVVQIVNAYFPDIRKIIGVAEQQTRNGKLEVNVETLIGQDMKLKIIGILTGDGNVREKINVIRQEVADAGLHDFVELYQILYQYVDDYASDRIPQTIVALNEGQFRDGQVPDKELNFMATLYNIIS
jgi:replication factor C small subunit